MCNQAKLSVRWIVWLWWILMSAIGGGVGFALGLAVTGVAPHAMGKTPFEIIFCAVFGTAVGITQWLVLRPHIPRAGWWMLVSTVGWTAFGALAHVVDRPVGPAVAGAMVGVLQWLVLRRHVALAGCWVLASSMGWAIGWPAASAVDRVVAMLVSSQTVGYAVFLAVIAAVASAFTGLALVWLLRHRLGRESQLGQSAA